MRHIRDPVTGHCMVCDKDHGFPYTSDKPKPNSKTSWDDVTKKMIYISQSNSKTPSTKQPGDGVFLHNASPGNSPSFSRRQYEVDSMVNGGRESVVSTSKIRVDGVNNGGSTNRSIVRESVVNSRSRDSSPIREIIREIHHYEDAPAQNKVKEKVREIHHYDNNVKQAVNEKVKEVHHFDNNAKQAMSKKVEEVHHYENKPVKQMVNEAVREVHHYDSPPPARAAKNVQSTRVVETSHRSASPPPKQQVVKEVRKETIHHRDNANALRDDVRVSRHETHIKNSKGANLNARNSFNSRNENIHVSENVRVVNNTQSMYRDASPKRSSGCCGKKSSSRSQYGHNQYSSNRIESIHSNKKFVSEFNGSGYRGASMGADVGKRRCCAAVLGLLALGLLGGLIGGAYYGIKSYMDKKAASSAISQFNSQFYSNGYYVNGVYVVPVTLNPQRVWLIYGNDVPCNKYNNNTDVTAVIQDCEDLTTAIRVADWTTTVGPVNAQPIVVNNDAGRPLVNSGSLFILFSGLCIHFYQFLLGII